MNRRAPIFAAIGMVLLVILVVFLAVLPKMRQVDERRDQLEEARNEEQFLRAELARLEDVRAQLPQVRRRLARFNTRVPASPDLPGLIRLLQNASDASQLSFFSIAPGTPQPVGGAQPGIPAPPPEGEVPAAPTVPTGDAAVIPAEVVIVGGFFEVDQFLFRLEQLPRAAKVTAISIAEGPDQFPELQVSLTISVFTTDTNAGPGAAPPDTAGGTQAPPPANPTPSPTPSPGESPTEEASPTVSPTNGG